MTVLPLAGRGERKKAPNWPLPSPARDEAALRSMQEQEVELRDRWADEADGRRARALGRQLAAVQTAMLELEAELKARRDLERQIWTALWRTPMAVEWERLRWTRTIARYARVVAQAELGSTDAQREARALERSIGLTPLSLRQLQWRIEEPAVVADAAPRPSAPGSRWRGALRAVDDLTGTDGP